MYSKDNYIYVCIPDVQLDESLLLIKVLGAERVNEICREIQALEACVEAKRHTQIDHAIPREVQVSHLRIQLYGHLVESRVGARGVQCLVVAATSTWAQPVTLGHYKRHCRYREQRHQSRCHRAPRCHSIRMPYFDQMLSSSLMLRHCAITQTNDLRFIIIVCRSVFFFFF